MFRRQLAIWGPDNQRRIEASSILVAGIGGLGCLMAEILVRVGVGRVYLCDRGVVDEPDLNRQLLYVAADLGRSKLEVASDKLRLIHPHTQIITVSGDLTDEHMGLPEKLDGVADCLDNFESRFALWNKLQPGQFFVHAGVEQLYGQVLTLIKGRSKSPVRIFANANRNEREIPVCGASASAIAAIGANEVQHNILGKPQLLETFLVVDLACFGFDKIVLG
jgi:molybdopterin synthase catalytic subunit